MASSDHHRSEPVAPFSLHCVICFDEFNLTDKPPVVLPCGHTYLCEPCSKRLKSCMECRKPLFIVAPKPLSPSAAAFRHQNKPRFSYSPTSSPSDNTSRKSPTFSAKGPPPRQELISMPIPKNLVLIALLEAAQQTVMAEKRQDEGYESGDDDEQVVAGMNLLSSDFGTYVVREKDGLVVQPLSPSPHSSDETVQACAYDGSATPRPNSFVNDRPEPDFESFDLQDPEGVEIISSRASSSLEAPSFDEKRKEEPPRPVFRKEESVKIRDAKPFMLRYGQTVQVVSFVDGVATLARRNGFIEASSRQLVKIGNAVDQACKIEGIISSVINRKERLRRKLEELDFVEGELRSKLDEALLEEYPDPYATAPGFEETLASLSSSTRDSSLHSNKSSGNSEQREERTFPDLTSGRTESAEFDNFVLSVTAAPRDDYQDLERVARSLPSRQILSPEPTQPLPYFGCTGSIIPGFLSDDDTANPSPLYDVRRPRNSVRHGIDFRTGLSGHMALTSSSAHVERVVRRREVRMMGEHRGLASSRGIRPSGTGSSLSNPTW